MSAESVRQPITVTYEGGVKFAANVRSHRIVVDQTLKGGGEDSAPTPIELLGVSLGTCVAYYVQQFLRTRGLPYEGMRVDVETTSATAPNRIGRFVARVTLPEAIPPQYAEAIHRVAHTCPAHNTLTTGADVEIAIAAADMAGV